MLRRFARRIGFSLLAKRTRCWSPRDATGCALVFSPHYDDETLGAGGAIIKLRERGIPVHLVFMTDGSTSHAHAMDGPSLAALRRAEALRAAAVLGVEPGCVSFLEFPEKRLYQHRAEAVARVVDRIRVLRCELVFVPSSLEPVIWSSDHRVTTEVVFEALDQMGVRPQIVEYSVWFWYHWPWVPLLRSKDRRQLLGLTWSNALGVKGWISLNAMVDIGDVRRRKRSALDEYKSQMTRLATDKPWPILADVAQGEFLENFFRPEEFFIVYRYNGGRR